MSTDSIISKVWGFSTTLRDEGDEEKDDLVYNRQDFQTSSSKKQLNFLQHIRAMLKTRACALL